MTEENEKKPDEKNLRIQNLFKTLQNDPKSVFYSVGNLSKTIINKAKKSLYDKDKVFVISMKNLKTKIFIIKKLYHL